MLEDGIGHGTTDAWRLYIGGVITGVLGVLAFQSAPSIVGGLVGAVAAFAGGIPW